jgi:DNA-directed RNA polymerase subunit M/transcription elongation factor TFIIS
MSKQALLQMYALNDKKKKDGLNEDCETDDSDDNEILMKFKNEKNKKKNENKLGFKNKIENFIHENSHTENSDSSIDNIEEKMTKVSIKKDFKETKKPHFSCMKCRTFLFLFDDLLTHKLDATKTVFFKVI